MKCASSNKFCYWICTSKLSLWLKLPICSWITFTAASVTNAGLKILSKSFAGRQFYDQHLQSSLKVYACDNTTRLSRPRYAPLISLRVDLNIFSFSPRYNNCIKHIAIERGSNGCFGLAENHTPHKTLRDLVDWYHSNSLHVHNPLLDITLKYPVEDAPNT